MTNKTVAIVGGGASGTLVAVHLLRRVGGPRVVLIDPAAAPGLGLAYSTPYPSHLLNVPCANLSAFPEQPLHFRDWARAHLDPTVTGAAYLPRRNFGHYLQSVLAETLQPAEAAARFTYRRATVSGMHLRAEGAELLLNDSTSLAADFVVLALGNPPPRGLAAHVPGAQLHPAHCFDSAWAPGALAPVPHPEAVLLVGSGLTAIDAVLALQEHGFTGQFHLLSRHGHLPQAHARGWIEPVAPFPSGELPTTVRRLVALVRRAADRDQEAGGDWRAVVDGLRPITNALWRTFSARERRRFQRHLRSLWEVHRHRMAPEVAGAIERLRDEGRLQVHAGRLTVLHATEAAVRVSFAERDTRALRHLEVGRVLNCTGPARDYLTLVNPLTRALFQQGLLATDPLGDGLHTDADGELLRPDGSNSGRLFTLGPPRSGALLETTAIPEIRDQAPALAARLLRACEAA
jgi:uncharacterized NAD(P)/FAD-binding protein YdhS